MTLIVRVSFKLTLTSWESYQMQR